MLSVCRKQTGQRSPASPPSGSTERWILSSRMRDGRCRCWSFTPANPAAYVDASTRGRRGLLQVAASAACWTAPGSFLAGPGTRRPRCQAVRAGGRPPARRRGHRVPPGSGALGWSSAPARPGGGRGGGDPVRHRGVVRLRAAPLAPHHSGRGPAPDGYRRLVPLRCWTPATASSPRPCAGRCVLALVAQVVVGFHDGRGRLGAGPGRGRGRSRGEQDARSRSRR